MLTRERSVFVAVALAALGAAAQAQTPADNRVTAALRAAAANAEFEARARVLTIYNREGQVVRTLGERAIYGWPAFSPDGTRLAVAKLDLATQTSHIWIFDLSAGGSTRITFDSATVHVTPVWSPDGLQIAYASNPGGIHGIYRRAANGMGDAELLHQHAASLTLTEWSADGRFLSFSSTAGFYGSQTRTYVLPIAGATAADRTPIDVFDSRSHAAVGRLSPDGRFLAHSSRQSGQWEVWVRRFDTSAPQTAAAGWWRISDRGGWCTCAWRRDGREVYYVTTTGDVMAVDVSTTPSFSSGSPRLLFKAPRTIVDDPISLVSVSPDGQQFAIAVPPPPRGERFLRQITVFDRKGGVVSTLGEPGAYRNLYGDTKPVLSPDGSRVAAFVNRDLLVFDVVTGKSIQVSSSGINAAFDQSSPVWSPDGKQIAFFSFRDGWGYVHRVQADGSGSEHELFRHAHDLYGPPLSDWSPDGRFLSFNAGGVPWALPLASDPNAVELMREEFNVYDVRFSPDSRFIAYTADASGRNEVYVRTFDPSLRAASEGTTWQVSRGGGLGLVQWREDGKELYYLGADGGVMAIEVTTTPIFRAGTPTPLFRAPQSIPRQGIFQREGTNAPECYDQGGALCETGSISRNGQRFAFLVPLPPNRAQVTVAPATLAKYVGTYVADRLEWEVTLEGNQLMIQRTAREKAPLFAESETRFFLKATNGDFEFVKNDTGDVICVFLYRGGAPTQMIRSSVASR